MNLRSRMGIMAGAMVSLLSGGRSLMAADALMRSARSAQPNGHRIDPQTDRKAARRINSRQARRSNTWFRHASGCGPRESLRRRMGGFHRERRENAVGWVWDDQMRAFRTANNDELRALLKVGRISEFNCMRLQAVRITTKGS